MNNAFNIWRELRNIYLKYIDTGLPIKYKKLEEERRALLLEPDAVCKNPIIELVPRYDEFCTLTKACEELKLDGRFAEFAKAGLFPARNGEESKIYKHQFEALEAAVSKNKHIIATTGTGSGKTECFLFPLIYDILAEKIRKPTETKSAVRGLILYPLNALAEDQMRRLRRCLSSEAAIAFLNNNANQKRISFGRYTGITPISGVRTDANKKRLELERENLARDWASAKNCSEKTGNPDYLYDIPNMDAGVNAEYWDRWTMQDTPPDILITNYSMLNIMLMRKHERNIFDKTRDWLESDKSNIFHLVIDELHSYRGTSGTEVAYLIRLLLMRLGLTPDSPQVRFLCSSASMQETERTKNFISGFFGLDVQDYERKFKIIKDTPIKTTNLPHTFLDINEYRCIKEETPIDNIILLFKKDQILERLRSIIVRAAESEQISQKLFGNAGDDLSGLEGLLAGLGRLQNHKGDSIQPHRAHFFFRNIDGLWACTNPNCTEVKDEFKFENRPVGRLYRKPQVLCRCGSLILEVLLCRRCGELYLGGWERKDNMGNYLTIERESFQESHEYISIYPTKKETDRQWRKCNLEIIDGKFTPTSLGDRLMFVKPAGYQTQYPNHCYNCDYTETIRDKGTLTPIFKHYTGVQKINQLMADSLMIVLNQQTKSDERPKLVLFSDSRQAAAKLSAGIEIDHYRDTLRAVLLNSLDEKSDDKELLKKYWLDKGSLTPDELAAIRKLANSNEYQWALDEINYNDGVTSDEKLKKYFSAKNQIPIDSIETIVINTLFSKGINPGGPGPSMNENWAENYDFSSGVFALKQFGQVAKDLHANIVKSCKREILVTIFAHNKRSLESLIQGKIVAKKTHPDSTINEFINSAIRILGESWRIERAYDGLANGYPKKLWAYARTVFGFNGWNFPKDSENQILEFLTENRIIASRENRILTGHGLLFVPAMVGDDYWKCKVCGTVHLHHSAGICTNCNEKLPIPIKLEQETIENLDNYYIYLAKLARKNGPTRLHCEELSGQTDKGDARKRQRLFQGRFLDNEVPEVEEIDLLSVTTTMEAGVDIGALSAVMMGNVPPQRFNYQQRVGRAGRRGKPLSVALTIAKGNSHDQVHYAQSHRMVSSVPSDPYLELNREEIFNRVFYKEILNCAFHESKTLADNEKTDSVHGEFGRYYDWKNYRSQVQDWVDNNEEMIKQIADKLKKGTHIRRDTSSIYQEVKENFVAKIDAVVKNDHEYTQIALSERLANAGYLPMFGFPTKVRILYESAPTRLPPNDAIDRNLDMAISEFAPGSEIIKDKRILKPVGLVHYEPENGRIKEVDGRGVLDEGINRCKGCGTIFLKPGNSECPICKGILDNVPACSPLGFCIEYGLAPLDFDGGFEWSPKAGEVALDPDSKLINEVNVNNITIRSNQVPSDGIVHQINDNDGELFLLGKIRQQNSNRWVVGEFLSNKKQPLDKEKGYVFISSRHTGVIALTLQSLPNGNSLDAFNPYHKAVFLSWAFLIRKSICDELDIEISEFDAGFRISPNTCKPEIYIVEKADNGAGYCNYLNGTHDLDVSERTFIKSLIPGGRVYEEILMKAEHEKHCSSSCYDCLRDYYNQQHHGLLNWRVALDLAALANDQNTDLNFGQAHWKSYIDETLLKTLENKLKGSSETFQGHYLIRTATKLFLLTHPFWSDTKIEGIKSQFFEEITILNVMDAIAKTKF